MQTPHDSNASGPVGSGWTADHILHLLEEIERRHEQRFVAQEKALDTALLQIKAETRAALDSSEKAIIKAEAATERRFESVNEFRNQLADQASRFMPRTEALQQAERNAERIAALDARTSEAMARINSRLDISESSTTVKSKTSAANFSFVVAAFGLFLTIISIVLVIGDVLTP